MTASATGRGILTAALFLLLASCASNRYIGSVSRQRIYVNRGFGVIARLASAGLLERWNVIHPRSEGKAPPSLAPRVRQSPLDLDGDGRLAVTETQRFVEPTLRLYASHDASPPRAWMDLGIQILPRRYDDVSIDAIVATDVRSVVSRAVSPDDVEIIDREVLGGFSARVLEVQTTTTTTTQPVVVRRAIIDQAGFIGEEGVIRRQIVRVTLFASKLDERLRADHDAFVDSLVLNRKGGFTTVKEAW